MIKYITVSLFLLSSIFSTSLHSDNSRTIQTQLLAPNLSLSYALEPNVPVEFYNFTFWTVSAVCTIETIDKTDQLQALFISKSGELNGIKLSAGDTYELSVQTGVKLNVTAAAQAKVKLTNLGKNIVTANCRT